MVALQVRRFDKTYEFKINLLQVRSVFECRCRLAVRAGARRHDPRPARSYNGAHAAPVLDCTRATTNSAARSGARMPAHDYSSTTPHTTHGSRGARPHVGHVYGRGSVLAERTLHSAAQLSAVHTKLLPDCPRLNGVRIRAHRLQHRGLHLRCRRVCRRRVQQPAAQLRL